MKRRVWIILLGCVVLGASVPLFWPREREPEYQGKKLSEWLTISRRVNTGLTVGFPSSDDGEAAEAVRQIGTNALPWLLRWIAYEPPAWKGRIAPFFWRHQKFFPARTFLRGELLAICANEGFRILGPVATPAVPELAKLLRPHNPRNIRSEALTALIYMGAEGSRPSMSVLGEGAIHSGAIEGAFVSITAAVPAFLLYAHSISGSGAEHPASLISNYFRTSFPEEQRYLAASLIPCLSHTNLSVRVEATNVLVEIAPELLGEGWEHRPELNDLVVDLTRGERRSDYADVSEPRYRALQKFREMGQTASPAIPELAKLLHDERFALEAATALVSIGPKSINPLINGLDDANSEVRFRSAYALGELGSEAKPAVPKLYNLTQNPDETKLVREHAVWALQRINGKPNPIAK